MDFDLAWCPACDRQIVPKRYTVSVPAPAPQTTPAPPSSPKRTKGRTGGLVNGTGRLRPNGTVKSPVVMKQRTVIDQGPIPLYCSDECQFADLHTHRTGAAAPLDPAREESTTAAPVKPSKQDSFSSDSSAVSSSGSSDAPLSSLDKFVKMYNLPPLPPSPPAFDEPTPEPAPREYNTGIMMAGKLITSLCPPPAKPFEGRYRPAQEPRKPIPGWTDGSNAWRSMVYSITAPKSAQDPFHYDASSSAKSFSASSASLRKSSYSTSALSSAPSAMRSASDDMISKFSENFARRSESRVSLYNSTATPSSPSSSRSVPISSAPKRERSLVHPGAQGKLLVPDVKLKVSSGSSSSLSSTWTGPTSASSRRSVRSPLSVTSDSEDDNDTDRCNSALSRTRRPAENTRSWSYDNVKTYDIMPIPPKKVKKMEKMIVDGEEREVEVEVEVYEERKRLFLFPPTTISA